MPDNWGTMTHGVDQKEVLLFLKGETFRGTDVSALSQQWCGQVNATVRQACVPQPEPVLDSMPIVNLICISFPKSWTDLEY